MGALSVAKLSVEQYLARDRAAEVKSEYHDGELFPVEAVSVVHAMVSVNVASWFKAELATTECRIVGSSLRVRVSPTKFVIPDLMVFCGKPALTDEHQDTVVNPKVIIEILSPSTAGYDYGEKFILYQRLPSFEEYVLISQNRARIQTFRKAADNRWLLTIYEGLESVAVVESFGVSLPLAEVYDGVELPAIAEN
jgi:Uma2 family endonuclease